MRSGIRWMLAGTALALALASASTGFSDEWPAFRGGAASGVASGIRAPLEWGPEKNIAWTTPLTGNGWSSPIVWGDRVFVTVVERVAGEKLEASRIGRVTPPDDYRLRWLLLCLDLNTGETLWSRVAREGKPSNSRHSTNSYASETPVTDGKRVYAYFGPAGLYCYDLSGNLLWDREIASHETRFGWGTGSSPALDEQRLYIVFDNEERSFVEALDKTSGKVVWSQEREEKSSWSTPFLWRNSGRTELVTAASHRVRSYDPETGELLWELGGMSKVCAPTPVAEGDLLCLTSSNSLDIVKPVYAIRAGASGDITPARGQRSSEFVRWSVSRGGSYLASPLLLDGRLYVLVDGFLSVYEADTGRVLVRKQRLAKDRKPKFTASPWAYRGRVFVLAETGETYLVDSGPEPKVVGVNVLEGQFLASPAIADGKLLMRSENRLYCIAEDGDPVASARTE